MKLIWIGPQRWVPKIGLCANGHIIDTDTTRLSHTEAVDLIRQKLAKPYRPKGARRSAKKES